MVSLQSLRELWISEIWIFEYCLNGISWKNGLSKHLFECIAHFDLEIPYPLSMLYTLCNFLLRFSKVGIIFLQANNVCPK